MTDPFPTLLTLAQVMERLKGIVGRTYLLQHLSCMPQFERHPTHWRTGRRIAYHPEDIQYLLATLESRHERQPKHSRSGGIPATTAEKAYAALVTLLN